jgi:hypothetical protein
VQPAEDLLPIIAHNPERFRLVANVNPALHRSPAAEAARQLDLGGVAVKVHPVHGGFRPDTREMYPVYELCAERRVPVIVHTGPSIFPGSLAEGGHPELVGRIAADFPGVQFVMAHGGRGQWYADAAALVLDRDNVWIDLAGLPPKRLPDYYAGFGLPELASRWIFGTDWPGVPGVARNVRAVAALGLPEDILAGVLGGNAARVYLGALLEQVNAYYAPSPTSAPSARTQGDSKRCSSTISLRARSEVTGSLRTLSAACASERCAARSCSRSLRFSSACLSSPVAACWPPRSSSSLIRLATWTSRRLASSS